MRTTVNIRQCVFRNTKFKMNSPSFVFATALFIVANAAKIPPTWKTCKRSLPPAEYDPCIYDAVTGAVKDLCVNGAPSLKMPPLDPLKITALDITQGSGPVAVDLKFKDLSLENIKDFKITNIRHKDAEKLKFGADVTFPKLTVKSKYELAGKVLVLPIKGKGDCELVFDDVRASIDFSGKYVQKGGEDYMELTKFDLKFDTEKLHIRFDNLFDGNKELGDNMNVFLNENWDVILKELKPAVIEALQQGFQSTASHIFMKVPYKMFFHE